MLALVTCRDAGEAEQGVSRNGRFWNSFNGWWWCTSHHPPSI